MAFNKAKTDKRKKWLGSADKKTGHDPREVITNLQRMIGKEEPREMQPFFRGWTGDMIAETGRKEGCYVVWGKIKRANQSTLLIKELPVGRWTQDYKEKVPEKLTAGGDKAEEKKKKGDETGEKTQNGSALL